MDQVKIGKLITKLRKERNMTQEQLAEKLSVSNRSISRWETGRNMPDMTLLIPLSEALGITTTELLNGETTDHVNDESNQAVINTIHYSQKKISVVNRKFTIVSFVLLAIIIYLSVLFIPQYIEEKKQISIFRSFTSDTTKEEVVEKVGAPDNLIDDNNQFLEASTFEYTISGKKKIIVSFVINDKISKISTIKIISGNKVEYIMAPLNGRYRMIVGNYDSYNYITFSNGKYKIEGNEEELIDLFKKLEGNCSYIGYQSNDDMMSYSFYLDDDNYLHGEEYPQVIISGNGLKNIKIRKNKSIVIKDE